MTRLKDVAYNVTVRRYLRIGRLGDMGDARFKGTVLQEVEVDIDGQDAGRERVIRCFTLTEIDPETRMMVENK